MKSSIVLATLVSSSVFAQEAVTQFPDGATVMSADALKAAVADKVFLARPAKGDPWRMQYNANGFFYVNVGNFSDNGKWSVKDSTVCTEGRVVKYFCNEFQIKDGTLYMKRESGEVLKFELR